MKRTRPSDLELQVLSVLWDTGPHTVRQLLGLMPDGKKRAYTTMLSVLQVMERKGLVAHDRDGLAHVYRPAVRKRHVLGPLVRTLVRNAFGGRTSDALAYLLRDGSVSDEELAEIRKLIGELAASRKRVSEGGGEP